jgi:hypothetical protein
VVGFTDYRTARHIPLRTNGRGHVEGLFRGEKYLAISTSKQQHSEKWTRTYQLAKTVRKRRKICRILGLNQAWDFAELCSCKKYIRLRTLAEAQDCKLSYKTVIVVVAFTIERQTSTSALNSSNWSSILVAVLSPCNGSISLASFASLNGLAMRS